MRYRNPKSHPSDRRPHHQQARPQLLGRATAASGVEASVEDRVLIHHLSDKPGAENLTQPRGTSTEVSEETKAKERDGKKHGDGSNKRPDGTMNGWAHK